MEDVVKISMALGMKKFSFLDQVAVPSPISITWTWRLPGHVAIRYMRASKNKKQASEFQNEK
jgi:hypothetical protein